MKTTRNNHIGASAALAALVGVALFLVSFSFASAYTLRARILPVGFSVGGGNSNGGASTGSGGNGGNAAPGGLVRSGNVVSNATAVNAINTTIVRIGR